MTNQIDELMKLADNYAHVYAFVGDDSMPIARKALEGALQAHMQEGNEAVVWQYIHWDGERYSINWHTNKLDHYYRDIHTNGYVKGIPLYTSPSNHVAEVEALKAALIKTNNHIKECWDRDDKALPVNFSQEIVNSNDTIIATIGEDNG